MGSRLQKLKEALSKRIGGEPMDPEVKANYEAGKREGMLQGAKEAGKVQGRKLGRNVGAKGGTLNMLGKASSKAVNAMEFLNQDIFGNQTPDTLGQAKKRVRKSSKKGKKTVLEAMDDVDPTKW